MCFRVSRDFSDADVVREKIFKIDIVETKFEKSYNVSLTQYLPVVIAGSRVLTMFKWGLIPYWAKDDKISAKLGNARSETLLEKPSFKNSFANKRCLILVSGFFEWDKDKTPYYVQVKGEKIFALAGLWDEWKNEKGGVLKTCTIITTEPNKTIAKIHNRMPVILSPDNYETWLTSGDLFKVQELLRPYKPDLLVINEVSREVNSVRNNSPELLRPLKRFE